MKKVIVILFVVLPILVSAQVEMVVDSTIVFSDTLPQRPCIWDSMPYVRVHQDSLVSRLIQDKIGGVVRGQETAEGFRVQIYSSNRQQVAKSEAIELEHRLERILSVKIYIQYISPFWKVRVGDFTTYEEAKAFKDQLLQHLPYLRQDAYIVRDQINVHP